MWIGPARRAIRSLLTYVGILALLLFPIVPADARHGEGKPPKDIVRAYEKIDRALPLEAIGDNVVRIRVMQGRNGTRAGHGAGAFNFQAHGDGRGGAIAQVQWLKTRGGGPWIEQGSMRLVLTSEEWSLIEKHADSLLSPVTDAERAMITPAEAELVVVCPDQTMILTERRKAGRATWSDNDCSDSSAQFRGPDSLVSTVTSIMISEICGYGGRIEFCAPLVEQLKRSSSVP